MIPDERAALAAKLRGQFYRDVPEGDGWSWERVVNPIAEAAATQIEADGETIARLRAEINTALDLGHNGHFQALREVLERALAAIDKETDAPCEECGGEGVEPCDNCMETDEHTCHLDGVEYGPSPCRHGCRSEGGEGS